MCVHWGLVRDWPVAQSHSNNGRHMGLGTKHMDRNTCGLPCTKTELKILIKNLNLHSCFHITGACIQKHYYPSLQSCVIQNNNLKIAWQDKLHTTVLTQFLCSLTGLVPMTSTFFSLTYFPHHPQPLLVVGPATSNKDGDLVLLQRTLVVFDGPHNALREETGR